MGEEYRAIPQEVGELPRNGGVRMTVPKSFTYLEPMEKSCSEACCGVVVEGKYAGAFERHIET